MLQMCVRQIVRKLDYGFVQEGDLKKAGSKKKNCFKWKFGKGSKLNVEWWKIKLDYSLKEKLDIT